MLISVSLSQSFRFLCFFLSLFLTGACISPTKKSKQIPLNQEQINQMDHAFFLMKNKDFLNAAKIYDELALHLKKSSVQALMLFNAGVAYKEAGQCKTALIRYRKLLDRSFKDSPFKARGLIEISYIYECLGNMESAFLSLKDVKKLRSFLPWVLNQIIYPARMAIAHAGLGQISKAEYYKSLSLTKILQSKTSFSSEEELNEQVSRMFYLMGRSYVKTEHLQPETFFKTFPYHQLFLLQSLFLKSNPWSDLSKQELALLFDKLAGTITSFKDKQKYKKLTLQTIKDAQNLVKKEKSKRWEKFYSKISQKALNLLSK